MKPPRTAALFPIAILSFLAALTFWLQRAAEVETVRKDGLLRHDPDFEVGNHTIRRFDPEGQLRYESRGRQMVHYPDDNSTETWDPVVTLYRGEAPVTVSALRGKMSEDGNRVELRERVRVSRAATPATPTSLFLTETLLLRPDDEFATTEAPVSFHQGGTELQGVGFTLDNIRRTTQINRVSGTIAKERKRQ